MMVLKTCHWHLVKTYCLHTLLFGCEIWNLCDRSMHKLNVAWNNCFRYIFRGFWRESVKLLQFFCGSLPLSYLLDQHRMLFWNRMMRSDNIVLRTLSQFRRNSAMAVGSVYNVDVFQRSHTSIKNAVWSSFTSLVNNVLGL